MPIPTGLTNFPLAPDNDRAADWDQGRKYRRDNIFFQLTGRADYSLTNLITLSSITSYQRYTRDQPFDTDGTTYQSDFITETGSVSTIFQELRLTGRSMDRLSWIVGANYESDDTYDANLIQFTQSSISQLAGFPLTEVKNQTQQNIRTSAAYANLDYDVTSNITLHGGIRYTVANRSFAGCTQDTGNGQAATALNFLGGLLRGGAPGTIAQPGQCVTLNADFDPCARPQQARREQYRLACRSRLADDREHPLLCQRQQGLQVRKLPDPLRLVLCPIHSGQARKRARL